MSYQNPLRILVVEDEALVARDLQHSLVRAGYEVTALCRTGAEALEAVQLQQPDVVLMDIHLEGGMDGVEAAGRIQRDFQKPVVFLTGHADERTTARARTAQPYGYLLKPFHESELRSVVELAVSRHRRGPAVAGERGTVRVHAAQHGGGRHLHGRARASSTS